MPVRNAELQADLLLEAELRGRPSHGLLRLGRIIERIQNNVANLETTGRHYWQADGFLEVDGGRGLGPIVASAALESISARAQQTGIAMAAIRNNNHLGMMARTHCGAWPSFDRSFN